MVQTGTASQPTSPMSQQGQQGAAPAQQGAAPAQQGTAPVQQGVAPAPAVAVMRPDIPIMGDIIQLSDKEWAAWTGGKPKADWSGLDASAAHEFVSPNQLHSVCASSAQKG